jgi:methyl-accepting chemotaxis protein
MGLLDRFKLGAKLSLAPFTCLVLMVGMAGTGLWGLKVSDQSITIITADATPKQLQGLNLAYQVQRLQMLAYSYLASKSATFSEAQLAKVEEEALAASRDVVSLTGELDEPGEGESLQKAFKTHTELIYGVIDMAKEDMSFATTEMTKAERSFVNIQKLLHELNLRRAEVTQQAALQASNASAASRATMVAVTLISIVLTCLLGWWVRRTILQTVNGIAEAARRLKAGDLSSRDVMEGRDEIAGASRALADTVVTLRGTLSHIGESASRIDIAIQELVAGNHDFSNRTEQSAATLQSAASNMARLAEQVSGNAAHATKASELAHESQHEAEKGGEVVGRVVAVMNNISAESRQIRDITSVIDSIAFQTNILALNAAVEAANAGEHGRGFSVVAGEVRTLSQRSARAAAEIKELVIRSVEKTESGALLATHAGEAMERILARAQSLHAMVESIAEASARQSQGLDEILASISVLEGTTQKNAALVEQAAAASSSVEHESRSLVSAIRIFRSEGD